MCMFFFFFISKDETPLLKCFLQYVVLRHITRDSNWHYRDTNNKSKWETGYLGQKLLGYGKLRTPPPPHTHTRTGPRHLPPPPPCLQRTWTEHEKELM